MTRINLFRSRTVLAVLLFFIFKAPAFSQGVEYQSKGFHHIASFSTLTGITTTEHVTTTVGFAISNLYRINPHFAAGAGVGLDFYGLQSGVGVLTPFFAEGRVDFLGNREITPFGAIRAGYATALQSPTPDLIVQGGVMLDAIAGVRVYLTDSRALNFGVGYRMQDLIEDFANPFDATSRIKTDARFSRFQVRIGLLFH